jgi:NIMA-interacting peptidyl-prolyl cis-trans isomerase 1
MSDEAIRCLHILVKHKDVRNPKNYKNEIISRTKEEANDLLQNYLQSVLKEPKKFSEFAKKYSDCGSASDGGDLGIFGRNEMHKPFEIASFALKVDEISGIIETASGLHIIKRIDN